MSLGRLLDMEVLFLAFRLLPYLLNTFFKLYDHFAEPLNFVAGELFQGITLQFDLVDKEPDIAPIFIKNFIEKLFIFLSYFIDHSFKILVQIVDYLFDGFQVLVYFIDEDVFNLRISLSLFV